jgi:hypothetical protein
VDVYLEVGSKKTFAGAVEWAGWCRSGRDEAAALQALLLYAGRYQGVLPGTGLVIAAPADINPTIVQRLAGNSTTDFGPNSGLPATPNRWTGDRKSTGILEACWRALDSPPDFPQPELRKGPRGGGRELDASPVTCWGDVSYLASLGGSSRKR